MRPAPRATRPLVRGILLATVCGSIVWALWIAVFGGFTVSVAGLRIRSNNPQRVLFISFLALTGFFLAGGRVPVRALAGRTRRAFGAIARRQGYVAAGIAALSVAVAMWGGTRIAGGSDEYGYVSQAELWMTGHLHISQPWVADVPWPNSKWTFTPLGYRPVDGDGDWSIVPTYSPGLPILMAAAKRIAGHCAVFTVGPLLGGLTILATYGIGRRLGSQSTGLAAAWFVATSPVIVGALTPLSDVPAMAAWTVSFYFLLGTSAGAAAAAGLFAAFGILIRPNLVLLAAPMGLWYFIRRTPGAVAGRERLIPAAVFAVGALAGVAAVAAVNTVLYGSPLTSGYGRLEDQIAWARVLPNMRRYLSWFIESQTPLAVLGLAALAIPVRQFWPGVPDRRIFVVIALYLAVLWGFYFGYLEFDSWGYLRFVLPSWPLIMFGLAAALVAAARLHGPVTQWVPGLLIIGLGVWNVHFAARTGAFDQRQAARHEAPIGRLVRAHTNDNSIVMAFERSGSLRYYAGRTTLRYDVLERDWLDRAVAWLTDRGVHVYAVLDKRQADEFRARFAGQKRAAAIDYPTVVYEPAGTALFDLSSPLDRRKPPQIITTPFEDLPGCDPPAVMTQPIWHN